MKHHLSTLSNVFAFTDSDLVAAPEYPGFSKFVFAHNLGKKYVCIFLYDNNDATATLGTSYVDVGAIDENNYKIFINTGLRPISGTWHVVVVG